jgi:hypothetical protein
MTDNTFYLYSKMGACCSTKADSDSVVSVPPASAEAVAYAASEVKSNRRARAKKRVQKTKDDDDDDDDDDDNRMKKFHRELIKSEEFKKIKIILTENKKVSTDDWKAFRSQTIKLIHTIFGSKSKIMKSLEKSFDDCVKAFERGDLSSLAGSVSKYSKGSTGKDKDTDEELEDVVDHLRGAGNELAKAQAYQGEGLRSLFMYIFAREFAGLFVELGNLKINGKSPFVLQAIGEFGAFAVELMQAKLEHHCADIESLDKMKVDSYALADTIEEKGLPKPQEDKPADQLAVHLEIQPDDASEHKGEHKNPDEVQVQVETHPEPQHEAQPEASDSPKALIGESSLSSDMVMILST